MSRHIIISEDELSYERHRAFGAGIVVAALVILAAVYGVKLLFWMEWI